MNWQRHGENCLIVGDMMNLPIFTAQNIVEQGVDLRRGID